MSVMGESVGGRAQWVFVVGEEGQRASRSLSGVSLFRKSP